MNHDDATTLARTLCAAFPPLNEETVRVYAKEIAAAVDAQAMKRAVEKAIRERERFPRVGQLLGMYREERQATDDGSTPPCAPCQREGGWRLTPAGEMNPPRQAADAYVPGKAWAYEAMCCTHGRAFVADLWVKEFAKREAANPVRA
jgi:hypothetical protein